MRGYAEGFVCVWFKIYTNHLVSSLPSSCLLSIGSISFFPNCFKCLTNVNFLFLSDQGLDPDLLAVLDLDRCRPASGSRGLVPDLPRSDTILVLAVAPFRQEEGGSEVISYQLFRAKTIFLPED